MIYSVTERYPCLKYFLLIADIIKLYLNIFVNFFLISFPFKSRVKKEVENMRKKSNLSLFLVLIPLMTGCSMVPENVTPVSEFDSARYLGKWYEIARFDFFFEKGLNNVTAEYSLNEDGTVRVVNRGYDYGKQKWKESVGKAKFRESPQVGALKVSFFGPFYAGYNVIAVEDDYSYALVCGKNYDYLWILGRTPQIPEEIKTRYLEMASGFGFDVSRLVWVEHTSAE